MKYILPILITCGFLFAWNKAFGETITTGNLLPNSGDGVDWGSSSTDQINSANSSGYVSNNGTVNGFDITCTNQSNCGYKYSVGGDFEVTGTATVTADNIGLTSNSINQSMLDNGVTLNSYIDVANCESTEGNCESKGGANDSHTTTIVLKDSSGNVLSTTTQTRNEVTGFQGNCNGYPGTTTTGITTACGQYNDRIIYLGLGANKVDWSWQGTDSNYTNQSRQGPNLLGASLNMTYNNVEFNPIDEDTQEVIEDIDTDIVDIIEDIPEDFDWNNDDLYFDDTYTWEEDEYAWEDDYIIEDNFYFEEEYSMEEDMYFEEFEMEEFDITEFEQIPMFEDFEDISEIDFEEMPTMEEVFFEEDFTMEPPPMMMEEVFTEEFEEDFTEFLEETGMEEEFMEFLEDEGITAEEFFEEIAEEEFNDELTEESFEEFEEPMEDIATEEESVPEVVENKEETMEESTESEPVEKEVASNEPTNKPTNEPQQEESKEDESDSEGTEDSEVPTEESGEQEDIQSEEPKQVDSKDGITTDVAKVENKLKKNLKTIAKRIAKVTKEATQNLSKEDLFFKNNTLDAYNKTQFYKSKDIYTDQGLNLFNNQIDLGVYDKEIYSSVTLASYTQNDPVEVHRVQLQKAQDKTNKLKLELEAMKNGG